MDGNRFGLSHRAVIGIGLGVKVGTLRRGHDALVKHGLNRGMHTGRGVRHGHDLKRRPFVTTHVLKGIVYGFIDRPINLGLSHLELLDGKLVCRSKHGFQKPHTILNIIWLV